MAGAYYLSILLRSYMEKNTLQTHGFSSGNQSNFFKSYQKLSNRSWLYFILETSTKKQFQNLNQI